MALALVVLECKHHLRFNSLPAAPLIGERVWCGQCKTDRNVIDSPAGTAEYRFRCRVCHYGRKFGQAKVTMEIYAARHGIKKEHTVDLILGNRILHTYWHGRPSETGQLSLEDVPSGINSLANDLVFRNVTGQVDDPPPF